MDDLYQSYKGKKIRNIRIKRLDPFGQTISDTTRNNPSWIWQTGNYLHVKTREQTIRDQLLFKQGDLVDPFVLADNEHYLRKLQYIEDARILLHPCDNECDAVDVLVITKDVWSTSPGLILPNLQSYRAKLSEANFAGFGYSIRGTITWNTGDRKYTDQEYRFRIPNISNTFVSSEFLYSDKYTSRESGVLLNRRFVSSSTRYAGGNSNKPGYNLR